MKKMTKKQWVAMSVVILAAIVVYLATSGTFHTNASYKDVFALSGSRLVAEGDDWQIHVPEKEGLACYFTYVGEKHPMSQVHLKAVIYEESGGKTTTHEVEWFPCKDRHFLFGEERYYFPENFSDVKSVACKLIWTEYRGGEAYTAHVMSDDLSKDQEADSMRYIETVSNEGTSCPAR